MPPLAPVSFGSWSPTFCGSAEAAATAQVIARDDVPVGGSLIFKYPAEDSPARLLVRVDENNFVVYEQQCTHLTCPVIPHVDVGELHAPVMRACLIPLTGRRGRTSRRPLALVAGNGRGSHRHRKEDGMKRKSRFACSQRMTIASGILFIVVIIIILQFWLFTATMNAYLGGGFWLAAIASLVCLGLKWRLLGICMAWKSLC